MYFYLQVYILNHYIAVELYALGKVHLIIEKIDLDK